MDLQKLIDAARVLIDSEVEIFISERDVNGDYLVQRSCRPIGVSISANYDAELHCDGYKLTPKIEFY